MSAQIESQSSWNIKLLLHDNMLLAFDVWCAPCTVCGNCCRNNMNKALASTIWWHPFVFRVYFLEQNIKAAVKFGSVIPLDMSVNVAFISASNHSDLLAYWANIILCWLCRLADFHWDALNMTLCCIGSSPVVTVEFLSCFRLRWLILDHDSFTVYEPETLTRSLSFYHCECSAHACVTYVSVLLVYTPPPPPLHPSTSIPALWVIYSFAGADETTGWLSYSSFDSLQAK